MAAKLASAGLRRVNVSCDSLRPERFASIRRRGRLDRRPARRWTPPRRPGSPPSRSTWCCCEAATTTRSSTSPRSPATTGRIVRFIEFMPLDAQGEWERARLVPGREVFDRISARWPLEPVTGRQRRSTGRAVPLQRRCGRDRPHLERHRALLWHVQPTPAHRGRCRCGTASSPTTKRPCADVLRNGGTDAELALLFRAAVWAKHPGHGINEPGFLSPSRSMSMIGG